jgi:hypothetical protein
MRVYDYSTVRSSKLVKQAKYYIRHLNWKKVSTWLLRIGAVGILLIAFLFIYYSRSLPDPNRLLGRNVPEIEHFAGVDGAIKAYERLL